LIFFIFSLVSNAQGIYQMWGMSAGGGQDYAGSIYSTTTKGDNYIKRYELGYDDPGASAQYSVPVEFNGKLYGMTFLGGTGDGVIFEWDPVSNLYTKKIEFSNLIGTHPYGSLTLLSGRFYGMTSDGGADGKGVIFEWDPATNIYTKKYDFNGTDGNNPRGSLTVKDGKFYGLTYSGGATGEGVIFEWDPVSNIYSKKIDLSDAEGSFPSGHLSLRSGKFYGMTNQGGSNLKGVIFEWDPLTNIYSKKIDLSDTKGHSPYGSLSLSGDIFYGMTLQGGQDNVGVIFQWDPANNNYTNKIDLNVADGGIPYGNLVGANGKFYGITRRGGSNDKGVIFEWDPLVNNYLKKVDLNNVTGCFSRSSMTVSNGKLYGITTQGGSGDKGVLFEWDPITNTYNGRIDIHAQHNGINPAGQMVRYNGKYYGMTTSGGNNDVGVIFEYDPNTNVYTKKLDLSSANGSRPSGSLSLLGGKMYGLCANGGISNKGVIFEWDPATNIYIKKVDFNGLNGGQPFATMTEFNGKFYGMTVLGGVNDAGVIFEWNPLTNDFAKKIDLSVSNGSYPRGSMLMNSGKFFGTTERGGSNDLGVIFDWDPVSNQYTKRIDFDGNNGSIPVGSLTAVAGKFYGMTNIGGNNNEGVIFEWEPIGNVCTKKFDFSFIDGKFPLGSLTWSGDKLYGTTQLGGVDDRGVLFEWNPVTNSYLKKREFGPLDGNGPGNGNDLILAPAIVAQGIPDNCVNFPPVMIDNLNNNTWVSIIDDKGDAVAEIKANGNNLGVITASTFINVGDVREDELKKLYLDRNITITPQQQPASPVDIRIYLKGSEYTALSSAINSAGQPSGISSINDIGIFKNNIGCSETVVTTADIIANSSLSWETDYVLSASITSFSSFYFANKAGGGTLPISTLEFYGRLENKNADLDWETIDELKTHSFDLEKSINGVSYYPIATIAAINHTGAQSYHYTDKDITLEGVPVIYYRLKQKDIDGRFSYSQIVAISIRRAASFSIYPNPVQEKANLSINMEVAGSVQLRLLDNLGRILKQLQWIVNAGTNTLTMDVGNLPKGVYYVELKGLLTNERKQILKQ
ncbi:MAG: choice-of-anchor tandem repeat GloVer-containing protein, partial [Ferruginibacter sp.]